MEESLYRPRKLLILKFVCDRRYGSLASRTNLALTEVIRSLVETGIQARNALRTQSLAKKRRRKTGL